MGNNITCSISYKYRITAKLYTVEPWLVCVNYVIAITLHKCDTTAAAATTRTMPATAAATNNNDELQRR